MGSCRVCGLRVWLPPLSTSKLVQLVACVGTSFPFSTAWLGQPSLDGCVGRLHLVAVLDGDTARLSHERVSMCLEVALQGGPHPAVPNQAPVLDL